MGLPNVYIAGRYSRREELAMVGKLLQAYGFGITSRWLQETYAPNVTLGEIDAETLRTIARIDLEDISAADVVMFYCEPQDKQPPRGGRHVEFGIAHALGKTIVTVGEPENVFHYLPGVLSAPDVWKAVSMLRNRYSDKVVVAEQK